MECYDLKPQTVRELVTALEAFVAEHGDMPVYYEYDTDHFRDGFICICDDERGLAEGTAPHRRAVISAG